MTPYEHQKKAMERLNHINSKPAYKYPCRVAYGRRKNLYDIHVALEKRIG